MLFGLMTCFILNLAHKSLFDYAFPSTQPYFRLLPSLQLCPPQLSLLFDSSFSPTLASLQLCSKEPSTLGTFPQQGAFDFDELSTLTSVRLTHLLCFKFHVVPLRFHTHARNFTTTYTIKASHICLLCLPFHDSACQSL